MRKHLLQTMTFFLCAILFFSSLISCQSNDIITQRNDEYEKEEENLKDDPKEDIDVESLLNVKETFDGKGLCIVSSGYKPYDDFELSEGASSVVSKGIQKRNEKATKLLNIKIQHIILKDSEPKHSAGSGYRYIYNSYLRYGGDADIVLMPESDVAVLMTSGILTDLKTTKYDNGNALWWDQSAAEEFTYNGKLYYTLGTITASHTESAHVVRFNKQISDQHEMELYRLCTDGKWTIDKMGEFSKLASGSTDSDGIYGLYYEYGAAAALFSASSDKLAENNGEMLAFSSPANAIEFFSEFASFAYKDSLCEGNTTRAQAAEIFSDNKLLFFTDTGLYPNDKNNWHTDALGILPYPKLTEAQSHYHTGTDDLKTLYFAIPRDSKNKAMASAAAEVLGCYGMKYVWEEAIEYSLDTYYGSDPEAERAIGEILSSLSFDTGLVFNLKSIRDELYDALKNKSAGIGPTIATAEPAMSVEIDAINDMLRNVQQ